MLEKTPLSLDQTVELLKAAGEPTRLRLLHLLQQSDLTVSDLVDILGQSQPRISRHLKLLTEAGLLERYQEGAWAYFRLTDQGLGSGIVNSIVEQVDPTDAQIVRDNEHMEKVRKRIAEHAAKYFSQNASQWDEIRSLHVDEERVEEAMREFIGAEPFEAMLDLGTGTGRLLELFSDHYERGVGIDASRDMLALARTRLNDANLSRVQTRQGDMYHLPFSKQSFDLVTIHQVLHFLDDPREAIAEAAKFVRQGGRLLIVDFAPHTLEFLQREHAHRWLGFDDGQMQDWFVDAGLAPVTSRLLEPASKGVNEQETLTVSLWLAAKSA